MNTKTTSIRFNDKDNEYLKVIMGQLNTDSPSTAIKYAIKLTAEKQETKEIVKDEWSPDMPHINDAKRPELKEKAKRNMESMVEMVDTPLGRMSSEAAKTLNMTNSEALSRLNGKEPNEEEIKHEKIMMLKRRYPEATFEQLEYYASLETDSDGNLIYD